MFGFNPENKWKSYNILFIRAKVTSSTPLKINKSSPKARLLIFRGLHLGWKEKSPCPTLNWNKAEKSSNEKEEKVGGDGVPLPQASSPREETIQTPIKDYWISSRTNTLLNQMDKLFRKIQNLHSIKEKTPINRIVGFHLINLDWAPIDLVLLLSLGRRGCNLLSKTLVMRL